MKAGSESRGKLSRRAILGCAGAAAAMAVARPGWLAAAGSGPDWSSVRGFNYQPSFGRNAVEIWIDKFDAGIVRRELELGRKYFPRMNTVRLWLSPEAFLKDPRRFGENFEAALASCAACEVKAIPVLFNNWHSVPDFGGISSEMIGYWFADFGKKGEAPGYVFRPYLEAMFRGHRADERILAWDLCNEPYSYSCPRESIAKIVEAESAWLKGLYDRSKKAGARAPITVGIHPGVSPEMVNGISDVLSIHPYWVHNAPGANKEAFEKKLDAEVAYARQVGKAIVSTECCWGSLDDAVRVESIRYNLEQLKKRDIGWLVYLLHHSLIADAHRPEYGPVGAPGYLGFIEADDTLRRGHEVFNEFP